MSFKKIYKYLITVLKSIILSKCGGYFSWRSLFNIVIIFGFIYQSIDLTLDYLKFDFTIQMSSVNRNSLPSITICFDKNIIREISKNYYLPINCLAYTDTFESINCLQANFSKIHWRQKQRSICLTLFSEFNDNQFMDTNSNYSTLTIYMDVYWKGTYLLFHEKYSTSHFEFKNQYRIDDRIVYLFIFNYQFKRILPKPYSTQCFDYSINRQNNIRPKSQTDCKLEYMRRKELKECKHNYYWSQNLFKNKEFNLKELMNPNRNNCLIQFDNDGLDQLCPLDCLQTDFIVDISKTDWLVSSIKLFTDKFHHSFMMHEYVPKMIFVDFISTLGGLLSMWLGISLSMVIDNFFSKNEKKIKNISIYLLNRIISYYEFLKISRFIKIIFKILISILMIEQLYEISRNYLIDNKIILVVPKINIIIPDITLNGNLVFINRQIDLNRTKKLLEILKSSNDMLTKWELHDDLLYNVLVANSSNFVKITAIDQISSHISCYLEFENMEKYYVRDFSTYAILAHREAHLSWIIQIFKHYNGFRNSINNQISLRKFTLKYSKTSIKVTILEY